MSWYRQMVKSQELVRERNRREERRQQGERYGPNFVVKYQLAALDKEKRMVEKELERIRKGIHKTPKLEDHVHNKANHILSVNTPRFLEPKHDNHTITPEYSKEEDHLYDAILFLQNNPSALVPILSAHAQSDAYLETLERITPGLTKEAPPKKSYAPKYLTENVSRAEKADLRNKYETLLHRHSPILRRSSPLTKRKQINSPVTHRDSPLLHDWTPDKLELRNDKVINRDGVRDHNQNDFVDGKSEVNNGSGTQRFTFMTDQSNECQSVTPGQSTTPRPRLPFSIAKLADDGMAGARENVSMRLSSNSRNALNTDASHQPHMNTSGHAYQNDSAPPTDDADEKKPRAKAIVMFPSVDPERFNADGTLRTVHNMPSFETRWEEAQKARYIRKPEQEKCDRELSVQEIFEKPS